jgi:V/A-type H+-transporting ATPase subunit C
MSILSPSADFVYGNTRLRARKADLLGADDFEALLGRDLAGVAESLAATAYRPEIELLLAGSGDTSRLGEAALQKALRRNLARNLGELRAFYQGPARTLVDLLLARYDLQNLLTLLRGRVRGHLPDDVIANLIPVGALGGDAAEEIARRQDPAAVVHLIVSWRLPEPTTARTLAAAWPEYERTQDMAALELALATHHARLLQHELAEAGAEAEPLRELVARERDATNALVVLRLRSALDRQELAELPPPPAPGRFLAGGRIDEQTLDAALRQPDRAGAATRLAGSARREDWRAPLERFAAGGELVALDRELEIARVRWGINLFLVGDPLSLDVPVAYTVAKENEVRNLRLVCEEADGHMPATVVRAQLVLPRAGGQWGA